MSKKKEKAFSESERLEHQEKYKAEVEAKYGESDAYKQSRKKTSEYTDEDWEIIMEEAGAIYHSIIDVMDQSLDSEAVQKGVESWRAHITRYYYDCTLEIFRNLAIMYVSDERFAESINEHKDGFAQFLSDAMICYCDLAEAK